VGAETNSISEALEREAALQSPLGGWYWWLQLLIEDLGRAVKEAAAERTEDPDRRLPSGDAVVHTLGLITGFPMETPLPQEIVIDNEGYVALNWDYGPRRVLSVRVASDGTLYYAGLLGHSSFRGVEISSDSVPTAILQGIERVSTLAKP
jgi:hypothetical protein